MALAAARKRERVTLRERELPQSGIQDQLSTDVPAHTAHTRMTQMG